MCSKMAATPLGYANCSLGAMGARATHLLVTLGLRSGLMHPPWLQQRSREAILLTRVVARPCIATIDQTGRDPLMPGGCAPWKRDAVETLQEPFAWRRKPDTKEGMGRKFVSSMQ